jgi:hypothetical protein
MPTKKGQLERQIVAVLKGDEQSRNSDIRLTQMIWYTFYRSHLKEVDGEYYVRMKSMYDIPREDNIKRIRAKIQNVEHRYVPTDPKVALKRGFDNVTEWREYLGYPTGDTL